MPKVEYHWEAHSAFGIPAHNAPGCSPFAARGRSRPRGASRSAWIFQLSLIDQHSQRGHLARPRRPTAGHGRIVRLGVSIATAVSSSLRINTSCDGNGWPAAAVSVTASGVAVTRSRTRRTTVTGIFNSA